MKEVCINEIHPCLIWLNDKYKGNNFGDFYDWYVYRIHMLAGATLRQNQPIDNNNVRAAKNSGGSTDFPGGKHDDPGGQRERNKFVTKRLDMEKLFNFNYNDMLECEPNVKFDKVKRLVFNHEYYNNIIKQQRYEQYVEMYNELDDDELDKINYIYQRFSAYILKNRLKNKLVDGSVICNISLMTAHYLKTGELKTDFDFFNMFDDHAYRFDEYNMFHLFLIRHCFTSHNRYFKKYIGGRFYKDWWAVVHLQNRWSDKDMKTKVLCNGFRDSNGKKIYITY